MSDPRLYRMDLFDDLDNTSAALIIQLQLQDSTALAAETEANRKGSERDFPECQLTLDL